MTSHNQTRQREREERTQTMVTLVANQAMRTPRSEFIYSRLVPAGMNVPIIYTRQATKQAAFSGFSRKAGNKSGASCVLYITGVQVLANLFPDGSSYPSDNFKQMTRPARDAREEESER